MKRTDNRRAVMLDGETLDAIDAEVRRRRMNDGGTHSRASVIRDAVRDLVQRWRDTARSEGGEEWEDGTQRRT
jgi:Arc/MetJ-type ribon-helix-helix transcriptional regulator